MNKMPTCSKINGAGATAQIAEMLFFSLGFFIVPLMMVIIERNTPNGRCTKELASEILIKILKGKISNAQFSSMCYLRRVNVLSKIFHFIFSSLCQFALDVFGWNWAAAKHIFNSVRGATWAEIILHFAHGPTKYIRYFKHHHHQLCHSSNRIFFYQACDKYSIYNWKTDWLTVSCHSLQFISPHSFNSTLNNQTQNKTYVMNEHTKGPKSEGWRKPLECIFALHSYQKN